MAPRQMREYLCGLRVSLCRFPTSGNYSRLGLLYNDAYYVFAYVLTCLHVIWEVTRGNIAIWSREFCDGLQIVGSGIERLRHVHSFFVENMCFVLDYVVIVEPATKTIKQSKVIRAAKKALTPLQSLWSSCPKIIERN